MRILFINTLYYPHEVGGAERSVRMMAEHLAADGWQVSVMSTHHEDYLVKEEVAGVQVFYVPASNIFYPHGRDDLPSWTQSIPAKLLWHSIDTYNSCMRSQVRRVLEVVDPEVVHTNNLTGFSTAVWGEIQRQNRALVHTIRDYYLLCRRSTMYNNGVNCNSRCWHCKPFSAMRLQMSHAVNAVVGISQFILDEHRRHGGFDKTPIQTVIPNPYDGPAQLPSERLERDKDATLRVGFLGRLTPQKGLDVLLEAARRTSSDLHVHVGGTDSSSYVESLRRSYPLKNVTYHGYVNPSEFLPVLDLLVVPSQWHEPLGRVVFEAYAYGVPVLGANRGGIPEMIMEGQTGYVFEPTDTRQLGDLLDRLADSPSHLKSMSKDAYECASRYRSESVVGEYRDVYREAAGLVA